MEKNFETEVLERLTIIETKLDDYNNIKSRAENADVRSKSNEKRIEKIEDSNKWLFRTSAGAVITSVVALIFLLIQIGIGIR